MYFKSSYIVYVIYRYYTVHICLDSTFITFCDQLPRYGIASADLL